MPAPAPSDAPSEPAVRQGLQGILFCVKEALPSGARAGQVLRW